MKREDKNKPRLLTEQELKEITEDLLCDPSTICHSVDSMMFLLEDLEFGETKKWHYQQAKVWEVLHWGDYQYLIPEVSFDNEEEFDRPSDKVIELANIYMSTAKLYSQQNKDGYFTKSQQQALDAIFGIFVHYLRNWITCGMYYSLDF